MHVSDARLVRIAEGITDMLTLLRVSLLSRFSLKFVIKNAAAASTDDPWYTAQLGPVSFTCTLPADTESFMLHVEVNGKTDQTRDFPIDTENGKLSGEDYHSLFFLLAPSLPNGQTD